MAEILRTWICQNGRCARQFDSWEPNPACPMCGCVRVGWVPAGGHIASGATKTADAELRNLAEVFRMKDINSAARDERAMPKLPAAPPADPSVPAMTFAPGFSAPVARTKNGAPVATCSPSTTGINYKAKVGVGRALSASRSVPGVHTATRVEARHTGRP